MYFELKKSINPFAKQPHYFVLKAMNNKVVMTSEMFAKRSDALDTINSIRRALRGISTVKMPVN